MANLVEVTVRAHDDATGPFERVRREIERALSGLDRAVDIAARVDDEASGPLRDIADAVGRIERDIVVRARADVAGMADIEHLRDAIDDIERHVLARVDVDVDGLADLDYLNDTLDRVERTATVDIRVDVDGLADLDYLNDTLDRVARRVTATVDVDIGDLDQIRDLEDALTDIEVISPVDVEINVDIDSIADVIELNELLDRIERHIRVRVDVDTDGGGGAGLAGLLGSLRLLPSLTGAAVPALAGLAANLAAVGAAAITVAPAVVTAVQEIAAVGRAVGQAAPALAAFAAAGGLVAGTLKLIFAEGSAMRAVLQPLADGIKLAGENASRAAAAGLEPLVAAFKKAAWPEVNHAMVQIGASVNRLATGFLNWAKSAEGVATIKNILHPIWQALDDLEGPLLRVSTAFLNMLGRIMGVSMAAGASGLAGVLEKLAQKFDSIDAESVSAGFEKIRSAVAAVREAFSTAVEWVQRAVETYMRFRTELGLVGDALAVVAILFGGPVAAMVGGITLLVRHFDLLKGAAETSINAFRSGWNGLAGMIGPDTPVLAGIAKFGEIARDVFDGAERGVNAFRTGWNGLASMIGPDTPVLAAFAQLGERARNTWDVISGQLVPALASLAGTLANEVGPPLARFAATAGGVVLAALTALADVVANHVVPFLRDHLAPVLRDDIIPAATAFAAFIRDTVVPAVAEFAGELVDRLGPALDTVRQAIEDNRPAIEQAWQNFQRIATTVRDEVAPALLGFIDAVAPVAAWFVETLIPTAIEAFNNLTGIIQGALNIITGIFQVAADLLTGDWQNMWIGFANILQGAWQVITSLVDLLWEAIKTAFRVGFDIVVGIVTAGVELIIAPFRWLYDQLVGGSIIPELVEAIIQLFTTLAARVPQIVLELATAVVNKFIEMMTGAVNAILAGVAGVVAAAVAVKNAIVGFFADAGTWLFEAGKNIIQGLVNGIKSMAGAVAGAVSDVVAGARRLLPFSPAKEGPLSGAGAPDIAGAKIIEMIAAGIRSRAADLHRAVAGALAGAGLPPVSLPAGGFTAAAGLGGGAVFNVTFETSVTVNGGASAADGAMVRAEVEAALAGVAGRIRAGAGRR